MTERTVELGKLTMRGGSVSFADGSREPVTLRRGDTLRLVVPYRFEETSREREAARLVLRATLGDASEVVTEVEVRDRPGVHDEQWGALVHEERLVDRGTVPVRYRVSVTVAAGPWAGKGKPIADAMEWTGELAVRVE